MKRFTHHLVISFAGAGLIGSLLLSAACAGSRDTLRAGADGLKLASNTLCGTGTLTVTANSSVFKSGGDIFFEDSSGHQYTATGVNPNGSSMTGQAPSGMPSGTYSVLVSESSSTSPTDVGTITYNQTC